MSRPAVVLLSGGLDSATALAIARAEKFDCHSISFDYGQRHRVELAAAERVAAAAGVTRHVTVPLDLRPIGGSALTADIPVPKNGESDGPTQHGGSASQIPVTYVPARNTVFLAVALGWAETLGAADLFVGVNAVDYSGYPDCRPAFLAAFETLANVATKAGVEGTRFRIHAPLVEMTKADIIRTGLALGVDYGLTHSCYDPDPNGGPCGRCDSCRLRRRGFDEAGAVDPLRYPDGV